MELKQRVTLEGPYAPRGTHVLTKEVNDEMVLVDLQRGVYHGLNAVGVQIWRLLDGTRSLEEIVSAIHAEYPDVERAVIEQDTLLLVQAMVDNELVVTR